MRHPVTFHYPSIFAEVLFKSLLGGLSIKPPNKEFPWSVCLRHICAFNLKEGKTHFRKTNKFIENPLQACKSLAITLHRGNVVPFFNENQPTTANM